MPADFKQGTNLAGRVLASGQVAAASATDVYTVPASSAVKVATAVVHNASALTLNQVEVFLTPAGGTRDATRRIGLITTLAPGDSTSVFELVGAFLEAGAVISLNPSAATAANYALTGAVSS